MRLASDGVWCSDSTHAHRAAVLYASGPENVTKLCGSRVACTDTSTKRNDSNNGNEFSADTSNSLVASMLGRKVCINIFLTRINTHRVCHHILDVLSSSSLLLSSSKGSISSMWVKPVTDAVCCRDSKTLFRDPLSTVGRFPDSVSITAIFVWMAIGSHLFALQHSSLKTLLSNQQQK